MHTVDIVMRESEIPVEIIEYINSYIQRQSARDKFDIVVAQIESSFESTRKYKLFEYSKRFKLQKNNDETTKNYFVMNGCLNTAIEIIRFQTIIAINHSIEKLIELIVNSDCDNNFIVDIYKVYLEGKIMEDIIARIENQNN